MNTETFSIRSMDTKEPYTPSTVNIMPFAMGFWSNIYITPHSNAGWPMALGSIFS